MRTFSLFFVTASALALDFVSACACPTETPFNFLTFGKTDMVQRVSIIGYRREAVVSRDGQFQPTIGVFELQTRPNFRDKTNPDWTKHNLFSTGLEGRFKAYWRSTYRQLPDTWSGPTDVIVGLEVGAMPDGSPGIFIAEEICDPPAIVLDTTENLANIWAAMNAIRLFRDRCTFVDRNGGVPPSFAGCP